jgi:hypothetical protein
VKRAFFYLIFSLAVVTKVILIQHQIPLCALSSLFLSSIYSHESIQRRRGVFLLAVAIEQLNHFIRVVTSGQNRGGSGVFSLVVATVGVGVVKRFVEMADLRFVALLAIT